MCYHPYLFVFSWNVTCILHNTLVGYSCLPQSSTKVYTYFFCGSMFSIISVMTALAQSYEIFGSTIFRSMIQMSDCKHNFYHLPMTIIHYRMVLTTTSPRLMMHIKMAYRYRLRPVKAGSVVPVCFRITPTQKRGEFVLRHLRDLSGMLLFQAFRLRRPSYPSSDT